MVIIVVIRLPFWPGARALRDGIAYSIGALVTHVAHPPGSIGYCLLGGWLNQFVGNVERTFIDINLAVGLIGAYLCYRLARTARLGPWPSLLAAATYALSINTLTAALTIAPHLIEGVGTILAAWLGLLAIQRGNWRFALGCTLTVALIGSFRPTASAFLIPLWLYSIVQSEPPNFRQRFSAIALNSILFVAVVATWNYGNSYYMTRAGYGGTTYEKQVLTPSPYDYVSMSTTVHAASGGHTYHLPAAEMLAWLEPRLHIRLLPHIPDWPTPSLTRAIKLSIQQTIKQATFLIVSLPVLLAVAGCGLFDRVTGSRLLRWDALDRQTWNLLIFSIWPAAMFFIFGHLGTLTYLQNYLGALSVCCAAVLSARGKNDPVAVPDGSKVALNRNASNPQKLTCAFTAICAAAGALVFAFGRPLPPSNTVFNLINVSLLQYTGPSKAAGYGAARIINVLATTAPADDPYLKANSDAELIEAAMRNHFEYLNPDKSKPEQPIGD